MPDLDITFSDDGSFPNPFVGTPEALKDAIIAHLVATVPEGGLLKGQIGGSAPLDLGSIWADNGVWKWYDGIANKWVPFLTEIESSDASGYTVRLDSGPLTSDREVFFQDKTGVVALLEDIDNGRATVILSGPTPDMDWSQTNNFYHTVTADTSYTFSNSLPGQEIWLATVNNSKALAFPVDVIWASGVLPLPTAAGTDLYIFRNVAGTITGEFFANLS